MGIDASGTCTGIAIYDTVIGDFVKVTKVHTSKKKATPTNAKRREFICMELSHLMLMECVDVVIIEDIYVDKVSSAIPLAALRGAIEITVFDMEYEGLHTIASSQVKKAVTGNGKAKKERVYETLKEIYAESEVVMEALGDELLSANNAKKNEDMSDAVAVVHAYLTDPDLAQIA